MATMNRVNITVQLTDSQVQWLNVMCERTDRSRSGLIRGLIKRAIEDGRYERQQESGNDAKRRSYDLQEQTV